MSIQISLKTTIIACLISILLAAGLTFYFCHNYYTAKYNTLQTEYNDYKTKVAEITNKDEDTTIAKAEAEKTANIPVTENIDTTATTTISEESKTSSSDADVEMTSTVQPIVVSYNGKKETLPTTTTESQSTVGNKVVIGQQTQATLDVSTIVNREIANRIDADNKTIADNKAKAASDLKKMDKSGNRKSAWCLVGGIAIGALLL